LDLAVRSKAPQRAEASTRHNGTPALPRQARVPKPGEPLWSLRREHVTWSAELRFHGESCGWEAQILREGELVLGRRFPLRAQAVQFADEIKGEIASDRWPVANDFGDR